MLAKLVVEAELLASLSERTAAIVQAYDIGTLITGAGEWAPYMVLSWLSGATLEDVLMKEPAAGMAPRSLADAATLLTPASNALALAHARGIAHRDVKSGNLFVTGDPRAADVSIKVLDFGIAKVVADAKSREGFKYHAHQSDVVHPGLRRPGAVLEGYRPDRSVDGRVRARAGPARGGDRPRHRHG